MRILSATKLELKQIIVNKDFNARKNYRGVEQLAEKIKKEGQITPIIVTRVSDKKYNLVAGFRRHAALSLLYKDNKQIKIYSQICEMDDEHEVFMVNLTENLERKSLSTYEIAARCCYMQHDLKMKRKEILERMGSGDLSATYIDNLMRCHNKLDDKILAEWSKQKGYCTTDALNKMAKFEKGSVEQLDIWDKFRGFSMRVENDNDDAPKKRKGKPSKNKLYRAYEVIKKGPKSKEKTAALAVFKYIFGESDNIKIGSKMVYNSKKKES